MYLHSCLSVLKVRRRSICQIWDLNETRIFFGSKTGKGIAQLKKMKFLNIFIMYIIVYYANLNNQRKTLKLKFKNLIVLTIPLRTGSDG